MKNRLITIALLISSIIYAQNTHTIDTIALKSNVSKSYKKLVHYQL